MKATAIAPSNIAFVKYLGKKEVARNIPMNPSISMNLTEVWTQTTVEFSSSLRRDEITLPFPATNRDESRIIKHLNRIRDLASTEMYAIVKTENSFPAFTGIASSASGFAALTKAATAALDLDLSTKEESSLAREASGSASRSIPDGFVLWQGKSAKSIASPDHWDLRDIIAIVSDVPKPVSSSDMHRIASSSKLYEMRLSRISEDLNKAKEAILRKDISSLGKISERDAIWMHAILLTSDMPVYYWNENTLRVMKLITDMRTSGLTIYFTLDAGPSVHILCEADDANHIKKELERMNVQRIIENKPAFGARVE